MKQFIKGAVTTLAVVAVIAAGSAQAGLFSSFATGDWPTLDSTPGLIDAYGFDLRTYEWTPQTAPHMTCVTIYSDGGGGGLQCFLKALSAE